tara:strand:+ start:178 stop:570 length:393 start_codon:yes stop_codon:yes gene_type:complete
MATQIVIANKEKILIDDSYGIEWADKGKNWVDAWCPDNYHYVIWNNLSGQNEIQTKNASTGAMTGNTDLNATSDSVGSTTVADLLTWAETRKGQIEQAKTDFDTAVQADVDNGTTNTVGKTWRDYDSNYS